jgi:Rab GDP dissociation inhibitor
VLVSTFVETSNPKDELKPGLNLLGPILHQFWSVDPLFAPTNNYAVEGIHISNSYDATSHFETVANDVIRIYQEVTGEKNVDYLFIPKEKPTEK